MNHESRIWRVRRLALGALLGAGGRPHDWQWRRAALEPFEAWMPPGHLLPQSRSVSIDERPSEPKRLPGPQF